MTLSDRSLSFIDSQLKLKADQLDHLVETNTGHREHENLSFHLSKLIHEEIEVLFYLREVVTDRMQVDKIRKTRVEPPDHLKTHPMTPKQGFTV